MTRKKILLTIAASILGLVLAATVIAFQVVQGGGTVEFQSQTTSGLTGTLTFLDQLGTQTGSWEIIVNGAPATVSVTISGCMPSGTCTSLATSSTTSNSIVSTAGGPYFSYQVAYTLTGGTSPTLQINRRATVTKNAVGNVVGAVASIVNKVFSTNWIEASTQPGADIETQISNACTALSALGAGGGFITVSFSGTLTGALGHNPFTNCPDGGNGTIVYLISPPNGTIKTSAPWLLTNKMRLYGGLGGRLARSWTTIQAGTAFKTMANLRRATLAQTTGLVRTGTGPFTVTATFTNTPAGTGCAGAGCGLEFTVGEPVQIGCSTHGDASFVGIWVIQTASATNITYTQQTPLPWQSAFAAVGNTNGTCTIVGGTPVIGYGENGKDFSTFSGTLTPYGNTQSSPCTPGSGAGTNCYGNAQAAFGVGVSGLVIDCDDVAPATGCVNVRNILSQEKTFLDDVNLVNWNFIALVLDNMSTSGLQNSGPFHDMEIYQSPLSDTHSDNCDPVNFNDTTSNNDPYPAEGIFAIGLSIRAVYGYTITSTNCGGHTTVNFNPGIMATEVNETGNSEWGTGGTIHSESFLIGLGVGTNGPANGGTSIVGYGGSPALTSKFNCTAGGCTGGTNYQTSNFNPAILISSSYATTDVTALNTRRNLGNCCSIYNQIDGDILSAAADAVTSQYAWDVSGGTSFVLTTSPTVQNRIGAAGLQLASAAPINFNRLITTGGALPTCGSLVGFGTGATCALISGSSDVAGTITVTGTATSPAALGTLTLTFSAASYGAHIPACVWNLSNGGGGGTWNARATVMESTSVAGTSDTAAWDNNAVNVSATTWRFHYVCAGN